MGLYEGAQLAVNLRQLLGEQTEHGGHILRL